MTATNRRRHKRADQISAAQYTTNPAGRGEIFDGVVSNLSESGLCILTTNPLDQGQDITIRNNSQPDFRRATVRWVMKYRSLYYRAGLEFR